MEGSLKLPAGKGSGAACGTNADCTSPEVCQMVRVPMVRLRWAVKILEVLH